MLHLAGFALAHAAWSVADAPHADLLVPFIIVRSDGQQELIPFEAATQDEAIEEGKRAAARLAGRAEAWAFAREGTLRTRDGDSAQDVLVVEFGAKDVGGRYVLIQPYQRATGDRAFAIVGDSVLTHAGAVLDGDDARPVRDGIAQGIGQHPAAAPLWPTWQMPQTHGSSSAP